MIYNGLVYRAHNPNWAWDPLSGDGATMHGGRFNMKGVPAFYTACTLQGAINEATPLGSNVQPVTLCSYTVAANKICDLTDADERTRLGINWAELECPNWQHEMLSGSVPASQALSERLRVDWNGILVQSFSRKAQPGDTNLILWSWNHDPNCVVELIDDEERLKALRPSR